jgi:hypothetical protein
MAFSVNTSNMADNTAEESSSDTALTFSPTANVDVGKLAIVFGVWDNVNTTDADDTTILSVTDSKSNSWTRAAEAQVSHGGALDGVLGGIFYTVITTQILTSDTITITSTAVGTGKGGHVGTFTFGAGTTIEVAGKAYQRTTAGNATSYSVTLGSLTNEEHLWVGYNTHEASDGATNNTDPDFTTFSHDAANDAWGPSGTGPSARAAYLIETGTTQTYAASGLQSADRVTILAAFREVAGAPTSKVISRPRTVMSKARIRSTRW